MGKFLDMGQPMLLGFFGALLIKILAQHWGYTFTDVELAGLTAIIGHAVPTALK